MTWGVADRYAVAHEPLQHNWPVHLCINNEGLLYAAKELTSSAYRSALEHKIMSRLDNINVCKAMALIKKRHGGGGYLVMELGGQTLRQVMQRSEPLTSGEQLNMIRSILRGVTHLHSRAGDRSRAVAHRDLKIDNIVIKLFSDTDHHNQPTPQALLIDFGSARQAQRSNNLFSFTSPQGTDGYKAPELASQSAYNNRVDILSLGVVLYQLLHGTHPFQQFPGESDEAIQMTINTIPRYEALPGWTSPVGYPGLTRLFRRMMSRQAQSRPTASSCLRAPCLWLGPHIDVLIDLWRNQLITASNCKHFNRCFFDLVGVPRAERAHWTWLSTHTAALRALENPKTTSPSGLIIALRDYKSHRAQTSLQQRAQQQSVSVLDGTEELVLWVNEEFLSVDFIGVLVRAIHKCWTAEDGTPMGQAVYYRLRAHNDSEVKLLADVCKRLLCQIYREHEALFV